MCKQAKQINTNTEQIKVVERSIQKCTKQKQRTIQEKSAWHLRLKNLLIYQQNVLKQVQSSQWELYL